MRRFVLAVGLLLAASAVAQTPIQLPQISIRRVEQPIQDSYTFGSAQCNDTLALTWTNTLTFSLATQCSSNPLKLWSTAGECQDTGPGATDVRYDDVPSVTLNTVRSGTFSVKISELPAFAASSVTDGGVALNCNSTSPFTTTQRICGSVDYAISTGINCGTTTKQTASPLKLVFDTLPPTPPNITSSTAQDKAVRLGFTVDSDTSTVTLEARSPSDADFVQLAEANAVNGEIRAQRLRNGVTYLVRLRAKDAAGNVSDPTDPPLEMTPIHTLGFWGYYKEEAGGTETGGCSVGPGFPSLLLALLVFGRRLSSRSRS